MKFEKETNLPCNACGSLTGAAFVMCPKCKVRFCLICLMKMMVVGTRYPLRCPLCDVELV